MSDDMQMTQDHSVTIGELAKALAAAQGEMTDAKKDAINPHFKQPYATLASVRAAVTPALAKNQIACVQLFRLHGPDGVEVVTMLVHASGEWIRSSLYMPATKKDAQGFGSVISYARRYSLSAITGIASEVDDDAEASVPKGPLPQAATNTNGNKPGLKATTPSVDMLLSSLKEAATAEALAKVSAAIGRIKGLDDDALERLRAEYDARLRALTGETS